MATITSSLSWDGTTDRWLLSMSQNSGATDNLGIPSHPYVKKCYVSLKGIREYFEPNINTATISGGEFESYLRSISQFVRVTEKSDLKLPTLASLGSKLADSVTKDWYGDAATEISGGTSTFLSSSYNSGILSSGISTLITSDGYMDNKEPFILRTGSTEHLSLEGWVYFKDSAIENEKFFTYDEAKKIQDTIEHRLEWMTKTETSSAFLPLSAGVASISPPRKGNLPNSSNITGICAGDTIRLNISGGAGDYSVSIPTQFTEVGYNTYRFVENTAGAFSIVVTDTSVNSHVTISIQTEEKT